LLLETNKFHPLSLVFYAAVKADNSTVRDDVNGVVKFADGSSIGYTSCLVARHLDEAIGYKIHTVNHVARFNFSFSTKSF